jgi:hypothetical protein
MEDGISKQHKRVILCREVFMNFNVFSCNSILFNVDFTKNGFNNGKWDFQVS